MYNKHSDTLATLVSMTDVPDDVIDLSIVIKTVRVTTTDLISANSIDEQEWHIFIIHNLIEPYSTMAKKDLKDLSVASFTFEAVLGCRIEHCP